MFHTAVQRVFFRGDKKYYIYFIYNLLLFPTVKKNQNRLTFDEVIAKIRQRVFETQCRFN